MAELVCNVTHSKTVYARITKAKIHQKSVCYLILLARVRSQICLGQSPSSVRPSVIRRPSRRHIEN